METADLILISVGATLCFVVIVGALVLSARGRPATSPASPVPATPTPKPARRSFRERMKGKLSGNIAVALIFIPLAIAAILFVVYVVWPPVDSWLKTTFGGHPPHYSSSAYSDRITRERSTGAVGVAVPATCSAEPEVLRLQPGAPRAWREVPVGCRAVVDRTPTPSTYDLMCEDMHGNLVDVCDAYRRIGFQHAGVGDTDATVQVWFEPRG